MMPGLLMKNHSLPAAINRTAVGHGDHYLAINDKINVKRIMTEKTISMILYARVWRCVLVIF